MARDRDGDGIVPERLGDGAHGRGRADAQGGAFGWQVVEDDGVEPPPEQHGLKLSAGLVIVGVDDEDLPTDGRRLGLLGGRPTLESERCPHRGLVLTLDRDLPGVVDVDDLSAPAPQLMAQVVREAWCPRVACPCRAGRSRVVKTPRRLVIGLTSTPPVLVFWLL